MSAAPTPVTPIAVTYGRQSMGKKASIEQQLDASTRLCADEGWTLADTYSDGTSASRFATKRRPDWDRLLADLDARRFEILILWESSRGDRRLSTWAAMLELARDRQVKIYVVTHERLYDLRIARDWKALAEDGTDSAYESEKTSMRSKRNTDALAKTGRPHGMIAYGYRRVREFDAAGRLIDSHDEIVPEQAAVIRETARRLLAGESMRHIVKHWNDTGTPSPKGKPWEGTTLRQIMLRDRNAGLRRHRGRVAGKAAWEPIYDQGTHDRVVALLTDPTRNSRASYKGATRKHLLSGVATCGLCDGPMRAVPATTYRGKQLHARYQCKGCYRVTRNKALLEDLVERTIVARLEQPDAIRALATGDPGRVDELDRLIVEAQASMNRAVDKMLAGTWTETQVDRLNANLLPKIEAWTAERTACAPRAELLKVAGPQARSRFAAASLDVKQLLISSLATVTVLPSGPGRRFDPSAVTHTDELVEFADTLRLTWTRPGGRA